jgi:hypothetical protein
MKIKISDIKAMFPCTIGWKKFTDSYGNNLPEITTVRHILKSNGVSDTLWVLDRLPEAEASLSKLRLMFAKGAIRHAERALPIFEAKFPEDKRPRLAIEAAKSFLKGRTTIIKVEKCAADAFGAYYEYCTLNTLANPPANAAASSSHAALTAGRIYYFDVCGSSREAVCAANYAGNFSVRAKSSEFKAQSKLILKYFGGK